MATVGGVAGFGRRMKGGSIGFDMQYTIDLSSVYAQVERVVIASVNDSARQAREEAHRLAPVRRVVAGDRRGKTRTLSVTERVSESDVRARLNIRVGRALIQTQAEDRRNRSVPSNPYLRAPGKRPPRHAPPEVRVASKGYAVMAGAPALSSRGKYELQRGDAVFRSPTTGRRTLGGRLRGEIRVEPDSDLPIVKYWVVSPTPYAKFVEFGTRRSRAQPYLRPALARVRRSFADNLRRDIQKLNWKPKRRHVRTR